MSVERIYQKKTQLEHILLRPDTYVGSVEAVTQVRERPEMVPDECLEKNVHLDILETNNVFCIYVKLKKTGKIFSSH